MHHQIVQPCLWRYERKPFHRFQVDLRFGPAEAHRYIRSVAPLDVEFYLVAHGEIVEKYRKEWKARREAKRLPGSHVKPVGILHQGRFQFIHHPPGVWNIVPAKENTADDLFLMAGVWRGDDRDAGIIAEATTCTIISECTAFSALDGRTEIAALLHPGKQLALCGGKSRGAAYAHLWVWDGSSLQHQEFERHDWKTMLH
ncbi:MAG TPA: hypothetical protein VJC16_07940 [Candidatus Nanoarchaeia archaeon]|nr:hypothetical protein [Candidatus Nanoarchaeia archaeon]